MPYMYILKCSDGSYYTGSTVDIEQRISQHNHGEGANYTRDRLPVELVYYEHFSSIEAAFKREHQVKKWTRRKKEALISEQYDTLKILAKKDFKKDK